MDLVKILKKIFNKVNFDNDEIYYLCNGEALPRTLTESEENDYIIKLEQGDENAKQILIERNLRLVVYVAKRFASSEYDVEDLVSIGCLGLIKAVNTFKGDKNIKIATYASRCIENEILMYLRKMSKQKQVVSLDDAVNVDGEGNELILSDMLPSEDDTPQDDMEKSTEKVLLWKILNKLNDREKEIMMMRFGLDGQDELTQKEVADTLGISQSYISRLEKKIVGRIKKEIIKIA